jgi:hypothetical protein
LELRIHTMISDFECRLYFEQIILEIYISIWYFEIQFCSSIKPEVNVIQSTIVKFFLWMSTWFHHWKSDTYFVCKFYLFLVDKSRNFRNWSFNVNVELTQFQSFVERIRCRRPQDVCTGRLDPTRKSNNPVFFVSLL